MTVKTLDRYIELSPNVVGGKPHIAGHRIDDDFLRVHARGEMHAGIVYAHQRTPVGVVIRGLMLIYQVLDADEMKNHVEFL